MSEQKIIELIILLVSMAVILGVLIVWLKKIFRERREEVEERFLGQKIIQQHNFAHFYGRESIGHFQIRGNGILIMTANELYFLKALPKREIRVPLKSISKVSNPRSHLGKTNIAKLLRIDFIDEGKPDAIAWMVGAEVEEWTQAVEEARKAL
ncbi:MAG: hypothetical protein OQL19_07075 [Gammaproteobacteria bacterium]|nr:hypothetical protein [Gammaproteobacteria bacterium]